jgi:Leucine-rich repeat (LRR) protein
MFMLWTYPEITCREAYQIASTILVLWNKEKMKNIFLAAMNLSVIMNLITRIPNAHVRWKGKESLYGRTLELLKLIDFSSNRLVGEIPEEFASLKGLMSHNLSSNNLNGNIIRNIGQMNNLEVLDLSGNNLSGEIPAGLSSLTFLSVLDLSRNNLINR